MKKILKKVLEELNKDKPNLDYIRGMIEVIAEEEVVPTVAPYIPPAQAEKEFQMMKNLPKL